MRTTAAMVCTIDVHTKRGAMTVAPDVTLGHEAVGVVHALGEAVDGLDVGQRVAVSGVTPCFECETCQRGFTSQCGGVILGAARFTTRGDGNMAEYFLVGHARANLAPREEGRGPGCRSRSAGPGLRTVGLRSAGEYARRVE
ncbi:hypothetical protein ADK74_34110 [Streptomyces decoyicus]|nr:hypothetical protein ADK74_34110 [Streptomyces decoyicus]